MKQNAFGFAKSVVMVLLIAISALFMLKFFFGVHVPFISLKDKAALYALVVVWNVCFAYFTFRIV